MVTSVYIGVKRAQKLEAETANVKKRSEQGINAARPRATHLGVKLVKIGNRD